MISLQQIKQLETRVHSAVARIRSLTAENTTLKESLSSYEGRIDELEKLVSAFKSDQQEIEAGIVAALSQLDGLEDVVADPATAAPVTNPEDRDEPESDTRARDTMAEDTAAEDTARETADTEADAPAPTSPDDEPAEPEEDGPELDIF